MPEPWEWTEADVQRLIVDQVQESLELDYKRSEALAKLSNPQLKARAVEDISKDVSAFANSAGGTIVYGVEEHGHLPIRIDQGMDPAVISRERLEQIINSNVQRRVPDVRINQVALKGVAPGKVLYVVHIPQSPLAPHMATDKKFYKRFDFTSQAMEEYEVRDVANRQGGPDLFVEVVLPEGDPQELESDTATGRSKPFKLGFQIGNRSPYMSEYYIVRTHIDARLLTGNPQPLDDFHIGDKILPMLRWSGNFAPVGSMPVWDDVIFEIRQQFITIPTVATDADYLVFWRVSAPRMRFHEGLAMLRVRHGAASIETKEDAAALDAPLVGLD